MRDERRKEEASKRGQTNNKEHSTPKAVKKNKPPRVGLEPMTLIYVQALCTCRCGLLCHSLYVCVCM